MYCENCGARITPDAAFCPGCGEAIKGAGESATVATVTREEHLQEMPAEKNDYFPLYTFVGPNGDYFAKKWRKNKQPGTGIAWNWAAFFLTPYWLGYRKMYKILLAYFAAFILIDILYFSLNISSISYLNITISVLMGLYGNALYYRHAKKKVTEIQQVSKNRTEEETYLQNAGGRSAAGIWAAIGLMIVYLILTEVIVQLFLSI